MQSRKDAEGQRRRKQANLLVEGVQRPHRAGLAYRLIAQWRAIIRLSQVRTGRERPMSQERQSLCQFSVGQLLLLTAIAATAMAIGQLPVSARPWETLLAFNAYNVLVGLWVLLERGVRRPFLLGATAAICACVVVAIAKGPQPFVMISGGGLCRNGIQDVVETSLGSLAVAVNLALWIGAAAAIIHGAIHRDRRLPAVGLAAIVMGLVLWQVKVVASNYEAPTPQAKLRAAISLCQNNDTKPIEM